MSNGVEYTMAELIAATGASARTIRSWTRLGLLQAVDFRGPATVYSPEHLARIRVIQMLRKQKLDLRAIKKRLAKATPQEIERLLAPPPAPIESRPPPRAPAYPAAAWERIILAPGLELHVRTDAGPMLRRVADDIFRHYGSGPDGAA
jgi:DNA-binding transcriptional MerR regulator